MAPTTKYTVHALFNDFLAYVNEHFPNFKVKILLPQLQIRGIIGDEERASVESAKGPTDQLRILFTEILPLKDPRLQWSLVDALGENYWTQLSQRLADGLRRVQPEDCYLQYSIRPVPKLSKPQVRFSQAQGANAIYVANDHEGLARFAIPNRPAVPPTPRPLKSPLFPPPRQERSGSVQSTNSSMTEEPSSPNPANRSGAMPIAAPDLLVDTGARSEFTRESVFCSRRPSEDAAQAPGRRYTLRNYVWGIGYVPTESKIFWSNRNSLYETQAKILGHIPQPDGEIDVFLRVSRMKTYPHDLHDNEYYEMSHPKKGHALIINNRTYGNGEDRKGSYADLKNMANLFRLLGYYTQEELDLKAREMYDAIDRFAYRIGNSAVGVDSCVVVVMTHGMPGYFIGTDGELLDQEEFFYPILVCKALIGKPKICIIQACRAIRVKKDGIEPERVDGNHMEWVRMSEMQADQAFISKVPAAHDFCVFYSTTPAYFSWRNHEKGGSWFIQAVCEEFSKHAHEPWADLAQLAKRVRKRVGNAFELQDGNILLPRLDMSNMTKKFHFFPGRSYERKEPARRRGFLRRLLLC